MAHTLLSPDFGRLFTTLEIGVPLVAEVFVEQRVVVRSPREDVFSKSAFALEPE
ncbi:hypothetical protein V5735_04320 (plasmid) [Haladaptatus sp. SPP-AMP-3]|uniref:hypothetical protein n=1 Tax=Haladaptatus sp. SPP-AMP-3 TaxID=3121295 RepID=UPI003C3097D7